MNRPLVFEGAGSVKGLFPNDLSFAQIFGDILQITCSNGERHLVTATPNNIGLVASYVVITRPIISLEANEEKEIPQSLALKDKRDEFRKKFPNNKLG